MSPEGKCLVLTVVGESGVEMGVDVSMLGRKDWIARGFTENRTTDLYSLDVTKFLWTATSQRTLGPEICAQQRENGHFEGKRVSFDRLSPACGAPFPSHVAFTLLFIFSTPHCLSSSVSYMATVTVLFKSLLVASVHSTPILYSR